MSQQLQITGGAKVRDLQDVIIGTSGVLSSLAFNVANGVPKLDVNGKILVSQLPNSVMEYQGTWNAATNTPTLVNGVGNQGDVYLCNVAGTTNFGAGPITFAVGDSAIYSGTIWQRAGGATGTVTSVGLTSTGNDAITITGSPITTSGNINLGFAGTNLQYINGAGDLTTFPTLISSIGLSMPSAFNVSNSPLTANGTIAVTGAGYPSQYIRGDGTLADFPTSGGGGSSVSYYLNGGTSQGTIGGVTYYEMSKTADTGTGVDFTKSGDGFIVAFLTDAGDPAQLNIPAGNWNYEIYASMSANGGTPEMYAELYKYDGTTFTLISTSSNEILYDGTNLNLYTFAMTVPSTTLAITDRLAVKLYATNSGGKTTTVHTQDSHLCQIITTFSTGITALNGLTAQVQYFATGTSGTDFNISSTTATHTFNIPDASATNRGLITTGTQTIAGLKTITGTSLILAPSAGDGGILNLKRGAYTGGINDYTSITSQGDDLSLVSLTSSTNRSIKFDFSSITSGILRTYTLPNASGTLALTSSLASYVPYTGAIADVNLGLFSLTSNTIKVIGDNSTYGGTLSIKQNNVTSLIGTGYTELFGKTNRLGISFGAGSIALLSNSILTLERTYTLPDASGTLTLTSDLNGYVPYSGATLNVDLGLNSILAYGFVANGSGSVSGSINLKQNGTVFAGTGSATIGSVSAGKLNIYFGDAGLECVELDNSLLTASRTYNFPNATGTFALLQATQVFSGSNTFSGLNQFTFSSGTGMVYGPYLTKGAVPTVFSGSTTNIYSDVTTNNIVIRDTSSIAKLVFDNSTQTYTFPAATGTLALTSNIPTVSGTTNYHAKFTGTSTIGNSLIWDNGTNVGIGNTNTSYTLDVSGSGRYNGSYAGHLLNVQNTNASYYSSTDYYDNAGTEKLIVGYGNASTGNALASKAIIYGTSGVGLNFYTNGSTTAKMVIDTSGNVGIGTSSPTAITGFTSVCVNNATTGGFFEAQQGGTVLSRYGAQNDISFIDTVANIPFIIKTNSTERMRITSGGKVFIGSTSAPDSGTLFNAVGTNTTDAMSRFYLMAASTLPRPCIRVDKYDNNNSTSQVFIDFTINQMTTASGSITANGANQATFTAWSDRRLKENITELSPQLENILALKPSEFDYKDGSGHQIGFIAQEMKEVYPDSVGENAEGFLTIGGWNKTEAYLVKAIQEMNTKLDEQNQTIQNLQEQINILAK